VGASVSDLLSADSLLLAVLAVLYGVWYSEIDAELRKAPRPLPAMNKGDYEQMTTVFLRRAVPLAMASTVTAAVFLPDAVKLAIPVIDRVLDGHLPRAYNAVSTSFFVTTAATVILAIHLVSRAAVLWKHRDDFDPSKPQPILQPEPEQDKAPTIKKPAAD
jgi:hypothetical protein